MSDFNPLKNGSYSFGSCDTCDALCCDGSKEILFAQIILKDIKEITNYFPILFTIGSQGYIRPVVLLTNGKDFCRYINNFKCSIYENRPSICKTYPLSAHVDNEIYIDTTCPAVEQKNEKSIDNKKIYKQFDNHILNNYQDKYIETLSHFDSFNKKENLKLVITINETNFYKFDKKLNSKYVKLHQKSLKHLNDNYYKSLEL